MQFSCTVRRLSDLTDAGVPSHRALDMVNQAIGLRFHLDYSHLTGSETAAEAPHLPLATGRDRGSTMLPAAGARAPRDLLPA
jgi:hypothetical protein